MQPRNLHDSEHVCNYTACVRGGTLKHLRQLLQLSPRRTRAWMSICHVFIFPVPKLFSLYDSILTHVFSYIPGGCTKRANETLTAMQKTCFVPWQATWSHETCKYLNYFSCWCANANVSVSLQICTTTITVTLIEKLDWLFLSLDDGWRCWFWRSRFLANKICLVCTTQSQRGNCNCRNPTECWREVRFTVRLCTLEHNYLTVRRVGW